jgi:hypothetical protein
MPSICQCESIAHTDDSEPSSCKASRNTSSWGCKNLAEFRLNAAYVICKECEASMGPYEYNMGNFEGKYEGMMWHVLPGNGKYDDKFSDTTRKRVIG